MFDAIASHYVATSGGGGSGYSAAVLADSPLGYWRLGEASGATVMADSSGNSRNGAYQNSPLLGVSGLLVGDADTAAEFVGGSSSARGVIPHAAWMNVSSISIEVVLYADDISGTKMIVERDAEGGDAGSGGGGRAWRINFASGTFVYRNEPRGRSLTAAISAGKAWHIVVTSTASGAKIYANGSLVASNAFDMSIASVTQDISIGRSAFSSTTWPFDGKIDEVALYDYELSSARVSAHFAASGLTP